MQIKAVHNLKTGEVIYSRAVHDYITDSEGNFVDGGQFGYIRIGGSLNNLKEIIIDLPVNYADLYNDWNNHKYQYGRTTIDKVKVLEPQDCIDRESFEFKKQNLIWGTYGKNGDQPLKYICLVDADTDHLEAILKTQTLSQDTENIIKSILEDRKVLL